MTKLSAIEKGQLADAILAQATPAEFLGMVRDRLQQEPLKFTQSTEFRDIVEATIDKATANEWLRNLLAVLLYVFKAKTPLGQMTADLLYRYWGSAGLQTLVAGSDMFDWSVNADCMKAIAGQVCMLEVNGLGKGTGILVGEDRVLTSYHVVESLIDAGDQAQGSAAKLKCRFDFAKVKTDAGTFQIRTGMTVGVSERWLLSYSEQTKIEREQQVCPPGDQPIADFDYALIQLAQKVGTARGWAYLRKPASRLVRFEPVRIAQHPENQPLMGADGRFTTFPPHGGRLQYSASTSKATSGSPCWNDEFDLVAIHNLGGINMPNGTIENQGIPIDRIIDHIKTKANGVQFTPPPPLRSERSGYRVWSIGADYPVLGRAPLQESLTDLVRPDGGQLLLVRGEDPGHTFTLDIMQRLLGQLGHLVDGRSAVSLTQTTPEQLVDQWRAALGLGALEVRTGADMSTRTSEVDRHLVDVFLAAFLAKFPVDAADPAKSRLAWLVIDTLDQNKLTDETHDFLIALLGQIATAPTLRVALIGYNRELPGSIARITVEDETAVIDASDVEEHLKHSCEVAEYMPAEPLPDLARRIVNAAERDADARAQAMPPATPAPDRASARAKARLEFIAGRVQKITKSIRQHKPVEVLPEVHA